MVNGEPNKITLLIENKSEQNVTLMNVAGSFHDPETNALIKNVSLAVAVLNCVDASCFLDYLAVLWCLLARRYEAPDPIYLPQRVCALLFTHFTFHSPSSFL